MSDGAPQPIPGFTGRRLALVFVVPTLRNDSLYQAEFDPLGRVLGLRLLHRTAGLSYSNDLAGDVAWLGGEIRKSSALHVSQTLGGDAVLGRIADEVYGIERDSRLAIRGAYDAIEQAARKAAGL